MLPRSGAEGIPASPLYFDSVEGALLDTLVFEQVGASVYKSAVEVTPTVYLNSRQLSVFYARQSPDRHYHHHGFCARRDGWM